MLNKTHFSKIIVFTCLLALIIPQTACQSNKEPVTGENYYLDTICQISIYEMDGGMSESRANEAIDKAFARCSELDKTLSKTVAVSDVSRINDADGAWVTVSDDTIAVLKAGIKYGELSDGAFDITIGTVTELWDFHADQPALPDEAELAEALTHVDYRNIEINGNDVRLLDSQAKLDLGGIAKGYIGGEMAKLLKEEGVTSGIVNLGGNVVTIGGKPSGEDFVIGVERPFSDRSEMIGTVCVSDKSVVTSGIYERKFELDGKLYHHIINAETGYPADTDLDAITVISASDNAMALDALSTICLLKGTDAGMTLIESFDGYEAVFISSDGETVQTVGAYFTKQAE